MDFHFDVDEDFAKKHNEMLRDTRKVVISGVSLFVICVVVGILLWFLMDPASPWRTIATVALVSFGVLMLVVAVLVPRSVGSAQDLYDRYPLVPAIVAEVNPRDCVIMALVNISANPDAPAEDGLALRTVSNLPGIDKPTVGTRVPAVAVGGRRSSRDTAHWQEVTPMPIAWATPDKAIVDEAKKAIPEGQWKKLEKALPRLEDVKQTQMNLLPL